MLWQHYKNHFGEIHLLDNSKDLKTQLDSRIGGQVQILADLAWYKNAILDGCSTVDSTLDYDGIGWYSMVLHGIRWYFAIE